VIAGTTAFAHLGYNLSPRQLRASHRFLWQLSHSDRRDVRRSIPGQKDKYGEMRNMARKSLLFYVLSGDGLCVECGNWDALIVARISGGPASAAARLVLGPVFRCISRSLLRPEYRWPRLVGCLDQHRDGILLASIEFESRASASEPPEMGWQFGVAAIPQCIST